MKRIISLLLVLIMAVSSIPFTALVAFAEENGSVDTGNAETDKKLNDYGFNLSLDSINGYSPDNGNVEKVMEKVKPDTNAAEILAEL